MRGGPCDCRGVWRSDTTWPSGKGVKLMTSTDATECDIGIGGSTAGAPPATRQNGHILSRRGAGFELLDGAGNRFPLAEQTTKEPRDSAFISAERPVATPIRIAWSTTA
jgi:hypothetical protein